MQVLQRVEIHGMIINLNGHTIPVDICQLSIGQPTQTFTIHHIVEDELETAQPPLGFIMFPAIPHDDPIFDLPTIE